MRSPYTSGCPASALLASAATFEALAETDSKNTKLMQKECDGVVELVSKYFKSSNVSLGPQDPICVVS